MTETTGDEKTDECTIMQKVEALLFVHGEPMTLKKLAKLAGAKAGEVSEAIDALSDSYAQRKSALAIICANDAVQIATNADVVTVVEKFIDDAKNEKLSRASLEVLSIIAYRAPITRTDIEAIRGVNCSYTLRHLLMRGLIDRIDNPDDPRGYLYRISFDFLKTFGIEKVTELPDFETLSKDTRIDKIVEQEKISNESTN